MRELTDHLKTGLAGLTLALRIPWPRNMTSGGWTETGRVDFLSEARPGVSEHQER